jgi:hypothetical protein
MSVQPRTPLKTPGRSCFEKKLLLQYSSLVESNPTIAKASRVTPGVLCFPDHKFICGFVGPDLGANGGTPSAGVAVVRVAGA